MIHPAVSRLISKTAPMLVRIEAGMSHWYTQQDPNTNNDQKHSQRSRLVRAFSETPHWADLNLPVWARGAASFICQSPFAMRSICPCGSPALRPATQGCVRRSPFAHRASAPDGMIIRRKALLPPFENAMAYAKKIVRTDTQAAGRADGTGVRTRPPGRAGPASRSTASTRR